MKAQFYIPEHFKDFIKVIWEQKSNSSQKWQILPSGSIELIFNLGNKMDNVVGKKLGDSFNPTENFCFLSGLHTKPLYMEFADFHVMGIQMEPLAAKVFFGIPCNELQDWAIPGEYLIDNLSQIEDNLRCLPNFHERINWLNSFIATKKLDFNDFNEAVKINNILKKAVQNRKDGKPFKIEDYTGYSRMHTHRIFKEWFGLSPGKTISLHQFTSTINQMHFNTASLTNLGLQTGFYDQAHFIRNFKEFAHMTPGQYKKQMTQLPGQLNF